jgi:hypothetical protein
MYYKFLVYFLAAYLPFYLPIRILYSGLFVYLPDIIAGVLFIIFIKKKTYEKNKIDILMIFFLIYSLFLVFSLSAIKGGAPLIFKHIHTFISGILMYFVARNILNKKSFLVLLNLYYYLAIIVSIIYNYEWINVNLFGNDIFSWVTNYYENFGTGEQFLDKGHLGFYRPMGIIGYSHATGIFLSGGLAVIYSKYQQDLKIINLPFLLLLMISIILTASRVAIISVLILFLTNWALKITKISLKSVFYTLIIAFIFIITFVLLSVNNEIILLTNMLFSSFGGGIGTTSIIDSFLEMFTRDIQQAKLIYSHYPLALFTGAGFPFYSQGQIFNPILTNDTYFLMWISQYGLIGSLLMFICLIEIFKRLKRTLKFNFLSVDDRLIIISVTRILIIYLFSAIHSSSIQMYPIYFGFFTFLGILNYMTSSSLFRRDNNFYQLT